MLRVEYNEGIAVNRILTSVLIACSVIPILYIAIPIIHLLSGTSWHSIAGAMADSEFLGAFAVSLLSALISTLFALFFGLPTAFILAMRRIPFKRLVEGILILPIVLPPVVGGIAQLNLYGPYTFLGGIFQSLHVFLTDNFIGVILAQTYITSPFLIFAAKAGFEEISKDLWDVTRELGGGIWNQFWSVSLPLAKRAIFVGALLTFTRAIGEFGATMIMAYHPYTLPVDLWVQFTGGGLPAILPMAFIITVIAMVVLFIVSLFQRGQRE